MSRRKRKKIDCPVCQNSHYKSLCRTIARGKIFMGFRFNSTTPAIVQERQRVLISLNGVMPAMHQYKNVQRCPLCYGKGWVCPELDTAYRLQYGEETDRIQYTDLTLLRQLITNSVGANEIREIAGG